MARGIPACVHSASMSAMQNELFEEPADDMELRFAAIRLRTTPVEKLKRKDVLMLANGVDRLLDRIADLEQERAKWAAKQS